MGSDRIVNRHHKKPYDVYIGRGSKWGNPFSHLPNTKAQFKVGSREEAIAAYAEWVLQQPELIESLPELNNKFLGCYCAPLPCHGDVLLELESNLPNLTGVVRSIECTGFVGLFPDSSLGACESKCTSEVCARRRYCSWHE